MTNLLDQVYSLGNRKLCLGMCYSCTLICLSVLCVCIPRSRIQCYYGNVFIADKVDVNSHLGQLYQGNQVLYVNSVCYHRSCIKDRYNV